MVKEAGLNAGPVFGAKPMIHSLSLLLEAYWYYFLGAAVLCAALCFYSNTLCEYMKKGAILLAILFALAAAFELVTGKNILTLPASIDKKLSEKPSHPEKGHLYKYDGKRYGEKPPD